METQDNYQNSSSDSLVDYKAQLLAVEAKLAKDPTNEELLDAKTDLIELIETLEEEAKEEEDEARSKDKEPIEVAHNRLSASQRPEPQTSSGADNNQVGYSDNHGRRPLSESELLAKKREKNKKKKAKLREKMKEQLDIAESEKQSWQSFASKKGLKGISKKSIFASPCSTTGKVGVGTNGIADAPRIGARKSD